MDLVILRAWPKLLDDQRVARSYAERLLADELRARYVSPCDPICSANVPYDGWRGQNEFEREASYRAFVEQVEPVLVEAGAPLPVRLMRFEEVEILPYDPAQQAFPLRLRRPGGGIFATVGPAASKLGIEESGAAPAELPMAREQAVAFLRSFPSRKRFAYLALEQTLGEPRWDQVLDRPALTLQLTAARLYADPTGRRLLHDFGAMEPAPADAGAEPATESGDRLVVSAVPPAALLYRLAPKDFADDEMLQLAKRQIVQEQQWLRFPGYRRIGPSLFTKEEIEGRVPDFVAQELLGAYRERIGQAVAAIPQKLTFSKTERISFLEYADGELRRRATGSASPYSLVAPALVNEADKLKLPRLGAMEVMWLPTLVGPLPAAGLPESIANDKIGRTPYLGLDRVPRIPPLALGRRSAEHIWKRPDCSTDQMTYLRAGMGRSEAQEAAASCGRLLSRYGSMPEIRAELDIEVEEAALKDGQWILKARLLGARLYDPRGELLKTYRSEDFPPAVDVWEAAEAAKAASGRQVAEAGAARAARVEAEQRTTLGATETRRRLLADADVAGVRLGMGLDEAERIARSTMNVGWVATLREAGDRDAFGSPDPNRPFSRLRSFISTEGDQQLVLFSDPARGDEVLGVARIILLPRNVTADSVAGQLIEKYGQPAMGYDRNGRSSAPLIWTVPSDPSTWRSSCAVQPGLWGLGSLKILEGPSNGDGSVRREDLRKIRVGLPDINVYGGRSKGPRNDRGIYHPEAWLSCGPSIVATMVDRGAGIELSYALVDLGAYAKVYRVPDTAQAAAKVPKL